MPSTHPLPNRLHVVAFDIPYPANYGGVIDIYYKIKSLSELGVEVILHCYQYGRSSSNQLKKICKEVHYYPRRTFKNPFYGKLPYIINSRNSTALLINLMSDEAPILFEGMHCTYHLQAPELKERFKIVRMHNIEHHYYRKLEKVESSYFKKYFFRVEADKLKKHLATLKSANVIAAISPNDTAYLRKRFDHVEYVPAFHPNDEHMYPGAKGNYILYHGNLGVAENYMAAIKLTREVFSKMKHRCIIAGNNPPKELRKEVEQYDHVQLRSNVTSGQIDKLIQKAHINVLYTEQNTGIKLKLLNALYKGKHAVVNTLMVNDTGLEASCIIAKDLRSMVGKIDALMTEDFSESTFDKRLFVLREDFDNQQNAKKIVELLRPMGQLRKVVQKNDLPLIS